jgi:anhydro-N-acetylmuramic acid kinase
MGRSLHQLLHAERLRVCGVMSGTSTDGLDIAVVDLREVDGRPLMELTFFVSEPFNDATRSALFALQVAPSLESITRAHVAFGVAIAHAITMACHRHHIDIASIDLVSSHGHTVMHAPERKEALGVRAGGTMQIGAPSAIAATLGIVAVGDFRVSDVALGGQGAPLMPYVDYRLLAAADRGRVALNIGGIANVTVLAPACAAAEVVGFDTGPGNMVIDELCLHFYNKPYDANGEIAAGASGVDEVLLDHLLADPYFHREPPKSTGREQFGSGYVQTLIALGAQRSIAADVLIRTATELTARTIADAIGSSVRGWPSATVIVSGGGAHNHFLMSRLAALLPTCTVERSDAHGLPVDAKEAMGFALLGFECIRGTAASLPSVTGAARAAILGVICQ